VCRAHMQRRTAWVTYPPPGILARDGCAMLLVLRSPDVGASACRVHASSPGNCARVVFCPEDIRLEVARLAVGQLRRAVPCTGWASKPRQQRGRDANQ
jgi:hypothetical protein